MTPPLVRTLSVIAIVTLSGACTITPQESIYDFGSGDVRPTAPSYDDDSDETGTGETGEPADDAPKPEAETQLRVFVTRLQYTADLGGLVGADETCQFEAEAAELTGTYRAWISDGSTDAIDRITGDGPWVDVNGERLFNNRSQLRTAPLIAIGLDPFGDEVFAMQVWTATGAGGQRTGTDTCADWTTEDDFRDAITGVTGEEEGWTDWGGPVPCAWPSSLYCFEVP